MTPPPKPQPTGHRVWWPISVALLVLGVFAYLAFLQPEMDRNFKSMISVVTGIFAGILLIAWFLALSRFSIRLRLVGLVLLIAAGYTGRNYVRVDGSIDGRGLPRLVWAWTPPRIPAWTNAPIATPSAQTSANAQTTALQTPPGAADIPQFLGPTRNGHLGPPAFDTDWTARPPKELWRQPIGLGWSAFAVVGPRAYTQEQRDDHELVTCYELQTGRLLWAHTNRVRFVEWQGGDGPRATPTFHNGQLFTYGGTGILDCLDPTTGRLLWSRSALEMEGLPTLTWGAASSPLVFDSTVVVVGGASPGPSILAFHRDTGAPLWKAGDDVAGYASPILVALAGHTVVLSVNAASLTAHNPTNGSVLLNFPWGSDKWPKASQPVVLDNDRVFLSAGYGVGCVMLQIRATADNRLAATELWRNKMMKTQFNSALLKDGYLYGLDDGLLACVDAATGKRQWKDGRYASGQTLLVGNHLLVQAERGPVALVKADPNAYSETARIPALSSKTWNYPTLAGRYLLVRNDLEAACFLLPEP